MRNYCRSRSEGGRFLKRATAAGRVVLLTMAAGCPTPEPVPRGDTVGLALVADGFTSPVAMAVPPNDSGRRFVVDQTGTIWLLASTDGQVPALFLDVRNRMVELNPTYDERGLLGLAFHPDHAQNRKFYLMYNAPPEADAPAGFTTSLRISEFLVSAENRNLADTDSERVLLVIPKPQFNHNGGTLLFGADGYLYISVGDGGGANDNAFGHTPEIGNAQDLSKVLGKILRIDVDGEEPYAIPPDNPFANVADAAPEVWALGLRNPYRMSFDAAGNGRLFVADAGQDLFEEVSIVAAGGNYGWAIREADSCFNRDNPGSPLPACPAVGPSGIALTDPIISYPHSGGPLSFFGTVVIGGYVYRGSQLPDLQGRYIFGDFSSTLAVADGVILSAGENAGGGWDFNQLQVQGTSNGRLGRLLLGFGQDADGEVYVLTTANLGPVGNTGEVFRVVPPG